MKESTVDFFMGESRPASTETGIYQRSPGYGGNLGFNDKRGDSMGLIQKVIPRENYRLEVLLDNGSSIILNLEFRLGTVRFCLLADQNFFKKVTTDGKFIHWEDQIEISLSELFQLAQK
jgi:hypothetical protein